MANEAVTVELINGGRVTDFTVPNGNAITKGTLCTLEDPRTLSGAYVGSGEVFAGIAASEKEASDGQTELGLYTEGIFVLTACANNGVTLGAPVVLSGANLIRDAVAGDLLTGAVVGKAMETIAAGTTGEVFVGGSL